MKKLHNISLIIGFVLLLGGLLAYALNKHGFISMDIEAICLMSGILGIGLIVGGSCELFIKQSKEAQIEAKDERNIMIAKTAKAFAFDFSTILFSTVIVILTLANLITMIAFCILVGSYSIIQVAFVYKLYSLQKKL